MVEAHCKKFSVKSKKDPREFLLNIFYHLLVVCVILFGLLLFLFQKLKMSIQ